MSDIDPNVDMSAGSKRNNKFATAEVPAQRDGKPAEVKRAVSSILQPWLMVIFSAAIALAGWFNYLASTKQWETMKEQLANANRQLTVAENANKIADDALKYARRPWVGVFDVDTNELQAGSPFVVTIRSRNSGQGPAIDAVVAIGMGVRPANSVPQWQRSRPCTECGHYVILPNGEVATIDKIEASELTNEVMERVRSGIDTVWIVGWIDYSDEFGKSHSTEVCFRYHIEPSPGFDACPSGNIAN